MSPLEQAAVDYVAARIANDNAEPSDWNSALSAVESAFHSLVELTGLGTEDDA